MKLNLSSVATHSTLIGCCFGKKKNLRKSYLGFNLGELPLQSTHSQSQFSKSENISNSPTETLAVCKQAKKKLPGLRETYNKGTLQRVKQRPPPLGTQSFWVSFSGATNLKVLCQRPWGSPQGKKPNPRFSRPRCMRTKFKDQTIKTFGSTAPDKVLWMLISRRLSGFTQKHKGPTLYKSVQYVFSPRHVCQNPKIQPEKGLSSSQKRRISNSCTEFLAQSRTPKIVPSGSSSLDSSRLKASS